MSSSDTEPLSQSVNIFVAHSDDGIRQIVSTMVMTLGHTVVGTAYDCKKLYERCIEEDVELIITGTEFPDGDGIDTLIELGEVNPLPCIVVTQKEHLDKVEHAMDDHVMAYLIDPVTRDDLQPTIYVVLRRFKQFQELQAEVEDLKEALAGRKLIERAKGILMERESISEEDAYYQLRKTASKNRMKLAQVASIIIDSSEQSV